MLVARKESGEWCKVEQGVRYQPFLGWSPCRLPSASPYLSSLSARSFTFNFSPDRTQYHRLTLSSPPHLILSIPSSSPVLFLFHYPLLRALNPSIPYIGGSFDSEVCSNSNEAERAILTSRHTSCQSPSSSFEPPGVLPLIQFVFLGQSYY